MCQGFIGDGIAGEALLLFHDSEVADMARLLAWQPKDDLETSEMLLDLAGIAEQIAVRFSQPPCCSADTPPSNG